MTPEDRWARLGKALKRCRPDQGRTARNNARRAVLNELRALRKELDAAYPVIPKAHAKPRRRRRGSDRRLLYAMGRNGRLKDALLAVEGIRPRMQGGVLVWPMWALEARTVTQLRQAKKSAKLQRKLTAMFLLRNDH